MIGALRTSIQTLLQDRLRCGVVYVKIKPMGKEASWEAFTNRQSTLDEFYPGMFPGRTGSKPVGEPEITIHINSTLFKETQDLAAVLEEICDYIDKVNKELCAQ